MELWLMFLHPNGKELAAYTVNGTFRGEMQATKELLAAENGLQPEEITVKCGRKEAAKHERTERKAHGA